MKVMICTRRGAGHFGPLIPFAQAFLRNDDEIVVTAPASGAPMIEAAGLDHFPYPDPPDEGRDEVIRRARQMSVDEGNDYVMRHMFVRIDTTHAYPHLLTAMRAWQPDAVLYDVSEFAAPLAAETLGIPAVCVGITMSSELDPFFGAPMAAELDKVRARYGLRPDPDLHMLKGAPHFTLTPAELEGSGGGAFAQAMRFREESGPPRPLPDWWDGDRRPLVYVTFGSVAPEMDFFPGLYRDALTALAPLPLRVLVTVGRRRDPRDLGPVSPNVHVARWVPQADVMPHTDVLICHGGSGTVRTAMCAGVPTVVVPLFADQPYNGRRVEQLGAGIALDGVTDLADAVRRLLVYPAYRKAAGRIARAAAALPSVDLAPEVVYELVEDALAA